MQQSTSKQKIDHLAAGLADRPAAAPRGRCGVVVAGMHRSGTSALTRTLNLLGLPLADRSDLWLSLPGNEAGYWESASLAQLNDELLGVLDGSWWCPPPSSSDMSIESRPDLRLRANRRFYALHTDDHWVWKDPRVSLTLPFWRAALSESFVGVLALRHPLDVAASLSARDGLSVAWSLALWERYTRSAVNGLRGLPVQVVPYDSLLADPRSWCSTLAAFLANSGVLAENGSIISRQSEVEVFLDPGLRHSAHSEAEILVDPRITSEQADLYFALMQADNELPELPAESPSTEAFFQHVRENGASELPEQIRRRMGKRLAPDRQGVQKVIVDNDPVAQAEEMIVSSGWRRWVAENLLLRVPDEDLLRVLTNAGVSAELSRRILVEVRADPVFQAGDWTAQRLAKLQSVLDIHAELGELRASRPGGIERLWRPSRTQFLQDFYARNEPVVLLGLVDDWPARTRWSLSYLRRNFGEAMVEVMSGRDADESYELNSPQHKRQMRFADYVDIVEQADSSNDSYLVANNHLLERPEFAALWDDFTQPAEYIDPDRREGEVFFWFGPRGTLTPLHHDVSNVMFVQVVGRKRFRLIPSLQTHRVYNEIGVFSQVDPDSVDLSVHPMFAGVRPIELVVEAGEALLIPVGWWHQVEALDVSISLSFTNFVFPNDFHWEHPEIIR